MTKMFETRLYVGTEFTGDGANIGPVELRDAKKAAGRFLANAAGNYTVYKHYGEWTGDDGLSQFSEKGLTYVIVKDNHPGSMAEFWGRQLAEIYSQACVLVTVAEIQGAFAYAAPLDKVA